MYKYIQKKIVLLCIKYGPSIMSLTCSLKILCINISEEHKDVFGYFVTAINWLLGIVIIGFLYTSGKYFGYCWKHQSLCRTALGGYLFYGLFIICNTDKQDTLETVIIYTIIPIPDTQFNRDTFNDINKEDNKISSLFFIKLTNYEYKN